MNKLYNQKNQQQTQQYESSSVRKIGTYLACVPILLAGTGLALLEMLVSNFIEDMEKISKNKLIKKLI